MDVLFVIGRIIFGGFFIYNGANHFTQLDGIAQYAGYKGIPFPKASAIVSGVFMILGGLSILLGYQVAIAAWLLILFLVPAAFMVHNFWTETDPMARGNQQAHFLKNIALTGASLIISTVSDWPVSLGG